MRKLQQKLLSLVLVIAIAMSVTPGVFAANEDTLEFTNLYDYTTSGLYNDKIWHKYSDYIEVSAGDVICIGPCVPTQSFHIVQFDASKTDLSSNVKAASMSVEGTFPNGLVIYKWTVPEGTAYIRVPNNVCVDEVFVITKNEPFEAEACYTYWAQTGVEYDALVSGGHTNPTSADQIVNLFDTSKTQSGAYGNDGTLESVSYLTTELIEVKEGDKLYFGKTTLLGKYQLKTFDANKNSVGDKVQSPGCDIVQMFSDGTAILSYTVPAGVSYVAVSCETAYKSTYLLTKNQAYNESVLNDVLGVGSSTGSEAISAYFQKDDSSVLKGLKIGFFGDSIAAANKEKGTDYDAIRGWAGRIGYKNQMEFYNMSVSGSSISTAREKLIYSQIVGAGSVTNGACDIYVMHGGTNDAWESTAIGTTDLNDFGGVYDYTTFAGGLDKCLYALKTAYPDAMVCYIINYKFTNPGSSKLQLTQMQEYVDMTKTICDKWGVPYLDLYSNEQLLADLKPETTEFLYDGVHLTSAGYELVTPYIEAFLKDLVTKYAITPDAGTDTTTPNAGNEETTPDSGADDTVTVNPNALTQSIKMTLTGFGLEANENVDNSTEAAHKASLISKLFGDITVTVQTGSSEKDDPKVFGNETRVYANNTLTITPAAGYKITSIVMTTQSRKPIGTAVAHLSTKITNATTNCANGDTVATFVPVDGTKAVVIQPGEQFRVTAMVVTYEKVGDDGNSNVEETTPTEPETTPTEPETTPTEPEATEPGTEATEPGVEAENTESIQMGIENFGVTANMTDSNGVAYYKGADFANSFNTVAISFGRGSSEKDSVACYPKEVRVYAGNTMTISPLKGYKITSIVIKTTSNKTIGDAMAHLSTVVSNATTDCAAGEAVGTFIPVDGTKAVTIQPGQQFRVTSIEVVFEKSSATGDDNANGGEDDSNVPDDEQKTEITETIITVYETFGLTANKKDDGDNPYYQGGDIKKEYTGFTIIFSVGSSTKDEVAAYGNEIRVYGGNSMMITPASGYKIVSVVVNSQSKKPIGTAVAHSGTFLGNLTTECADGETVGTFIPVDGTKAVLIQPGTQFRVTSIVVTYAESDDTDAGAISGGVVYEDGDGTAKSATVGTNYETFELTAGNMDTEGNLYYQGGAFWRTFESFIIAFGNGGNEEDLVAAYGNEIRVYAGNTVTITPLKGYKITSVEITSQSKMPIGNALMNLSTTVKNATTSCGAGDTVATFVPVVGTKAVFIEMGEQVRITSIKVVYEPATEEDEISDETKKPADDVTVPVTTQPTDPTQPGSDNQGGDMTGVIVMVVAIAAIAVAIVIVAAKKKKRAA